MISTKQSLRKVAGLAALSVLVSGCGSLFGVDGYFRDRGDDYLLSEPLEPLKMPEGVETQRIQPLYAIPAITNEGDFDGVGEFEVPRPQSMSANLLEETVKIQKLGNRRWILVNVPPSEVWPQLSRFLAQNNLAVVYSDTNSGVIETSWIQFKDNLAKKDKFRMQIDQGVQPDTSEIHITHMNIDSSIPAAGQVNWPARSMDPVREGLLLDELAATLASDLSGGTSMLAQNIGSGSKVVLAQVDGEPVLKMQLESARAWATLGYSVNQGGYFAFDDDRQMGIYYVSYIKPVENSDGWFSWGSDEPEIPTTPYSLMDLVSHLQLGDSEKNKAIFSSLPSAAPEPLDNVEGYLVIIRGDDFDVQVRIRDGYGRELEPKIARKLLGILRSNLI